MRVGLGIGGIEFNIVRFGGFFPNFGNRVELNRVWFNGKVRILEP